jgi:hypothetical protein
VEVEPRRGYLHLVLRGDVETPDAALHLGALAVRVMERHETPRLLVDARAVPELPKEACDAGWAWLAEGACRQLAWVIPAGADAEMNVTRINMMAVSSSLPIRAFSAIIDAHRWLDAKQPDRRLSSVIGAVRPTERPPPMSSGPPPTTPPRGSNGPGKSSGEWHALTDAEARIARARKPTFTGKSTGDWPRVTDEPKDDSG